MTTLESRAMRPHSPWAPAIIFFVFLLIGPFIGALTFFVPSLIIDAMFGNKVGSIPGGWSTRMAVGGILYILPFAYFVGGLQAVVVGIVALVFERRSITGLVPLVPVLIASLLSAAIIMFVLKMRHTLSDWTLVIMVHIISGFVCWILANAAIYPLRKKIAAGAAR